MSIKFFANIVLLLKFVVTTAQVAQKYVQLAFTSLPHRQPVQYLLIQVLDIIIKCISSKPNI